MRNWFILGRYHWFVLFVLLSVCAVIVAWMSFGLINTAMANVDFLRLHGLLAVREGGLVQLLEIGVQSFLALVSYLGFKSIETELIYRWLGHGRRH